MNSLKCNLTSHDSEQIKTALAGCEKMLIDLRNSLDKRGLDSSLSAYIVYTRVFKLIGMVELADAMGIDVTGYEWLWRLKPSQNG